MIKTIYKCSKVFIYNCVNQVVFCFGDLPYTDYDVTVGFAYVTARVFLQEYVIPSAQNVIPKAVWQPCCRLLKVNSHYYSVQMGATSGGGLGQCCQIRITKSNARVP